MLRGTYYHPWSIGEFEESVVVEGIHVSCLFVVVSGGASLLSPTKAGWIDRSGREREREKRAGWGGVEWMERGKNNEAVTGDEDKFF